LILKRDLTLGAKLAVTFAALFFVLAGVGIFNAHQMHEVSSAAVEIEAEWLPSINALAELKLMFTRAADRRSCDRHR
jgi:methyl-accepting chemotaxis protein